MSKSPDRKSRILVKLSTKQLTEFKEFQLSSNMSETQTFWRRSRSAFQLATFNFDFKILQFERKLGMHKEDGELVAEEMKKAKLIV